jgi:hypothetical protein
MSRLFLDQANATVFQLRSTLVSARGMLWGTLSPGLTTAWPATD